MKRKAFKLLRVRANGTLGPLFINRAQVIPLNKWLVAEDHRTKGYAHRPGWHTTNQPRAPHLCLKQRKWFKVEIDGFKILQRPVSQGGTWYLSKKMRVVKPI